MPKRTYSQAQLLTARRAIRYPGQYKRARLRRDQLAYARRTSAVVVPFVPGYTRTVGAYRRGGVTTEKKYLDTNLAQTGDLSAGVITQLTLVPQGTTDVTRIGNKITVRNVNLQGEFTLDDAGTATYGNGIIRGMLIMDMQANGAAAAVTDVLKYAQCFSYRNMDQVDRFKVLVDKFWTVSNNSNALHTSQGNTRFKMKWKGAQDVHFSSTTGAITELRSNNFFVLWISNGSSVNVNGGVALSSASTSTGRIKFTDA